MKFYTDSLEIILKIRYHLSGLIRTADFRVFPLISMIEREKRLPKSELWKHYRD